LLFPRKNRLLDPQDYTRVFKQGQKFRCDGFAFICRINEFPHARLGLAIAKKHIASAVGRNRIRRIIREGFRYHQATLGNVDIVVITQRHLQTWRKPYLYEDLSRQWQRLSASFKGAS